jgi:hypothetical protein
MSKWKGKSKTKQKATCSNYFCIVLRLCKPLFLGGKYLALATTAAVFSVILSADFRLLTHPLQVLLSEAAKILSKKINDVSFLGYVYII